MLANLGIAVVSMMVAWATIDAWVVAQFFGGRSTAAATSWVDPVFGKPLSFYFFELPFYRDSVSFFLTLGVVAILVYYGSSIPFGAKTFNFEFGKLARIVAAFVLVAYAARLY